MPPGKPIPLTEFYLTSMLNLLPDGVEKVLTELKALYLVSLSSRSELPCDGEVDMISQNSTEFTYDSEYGWIRVICQPQHEIQIQQKFQLIVEAMEPANLANNKRIFNVCCFGLPSSPR